MPAPEAPAPAAIRPGRQRSDACDAAILDATLRLLGERGYSGLTVAAVIEAAGVSSATLYRRWPTKQDLVAAAVATMVPEPANTDTGSLAGDLAAFLQHVASSIAARQEGIADALSIEKKHNPELAALLRARFREPRLAELRAIFVRAKRRGEVSAVPPTEVALSLIAGPLYHRSSSLGEPLTPAFMRAAAAHAVRALQA
jgi:AcrR family transcriptional regulator